MVCSSSLLSTNGSCDVYRHESDPRHGKKFTTAHPDWKSGTYELFGDYVKSQFCKSPRFDFQESLADGFAQPKRKMRMSTARRKMKSPIWILTQTATRRC